MARLDSRVLMDFLEEVDKELERKITLIAVGGTALTLLGAKSSTRDVDFTLPSDNYGESQRALKKSSRGFVVLCAHGAYESKQKRGKPSLLAPYPFSRGSCL